MFFKFLLYELKYALRSRTVVMVLVVAPIFYGLFYAYPYTNEIPRKVPVAVVDQDRSKLSRQFIDMVNSAENSAVVYIAPSIEDAKNLFYDRKIYAIVIIPMDFEQAVLQGSVANISLYTDGSYLLYYKQTYGAIQTVAGILGAGIAMQRLQSAGVPYYAVGSQRTSVSLNSYPLYNPLSGYATYVLPTVFVLICHQLILVGISMVMAHQREDEKYFAMCKAHNITPTQNLLIKTLVYFFVITFQALFLFCVALPLFEIPFNGVFVELIVFLFPFFLSVIFLGVILGTIIKVPATCILYIAVTSIPLLFLSGVPWSKLAMPWIVQQVRMIFPSTYAIEGFIRIYREGATLVDVYPLVKALWIIAAVMLVIAYFRLRNAGLKTQIKGGVALG